MKPLLAAPIEFDANDPESLVAELSKIQFPVVGSPKVDGWRILSHPTLGAVTRQFKPLRNDYVRQILSNSALAGLDGEVTVGEPNVGNTFNATTRGISPAAGEPQFTWWVFDDFTKPDWSYLTRSNVAWERIQKLNDPRFQFLEQELLSNVDDLLTYEAKCLEQGFEGICLRDPTGPYKFNRSTFKQGILLKLKRRADDEAEVLRIEPRQQNNNEAQTSALGYTKRSAHQSNKTNLPIVGKLIVKSINNLWNSAEFGIGTGFDHATATQWWTNPELILGKVVKYQYQPCGTLDLPRQPSFKGFRED